MDAAAASEWQAAAERLRAELEPALRRELETSIRRELAAEQVPPPTPHVVTTDSLELIACPPGLPSLLQSSAEAGVYVEFATETWAVGQAPAAGHRGRGGAGSGVHLPRVCETASE